jgi:predicted DNA-binding transcriptional regulator AlpA
MATRSSTVAKPEQLASTAEVANVLGIPGKTLVEWRSRGIGPDYLKVGRYVRYRWSAVNAWLATREQRKPGAA